MNFICLDGCLFLTRIEEFFALALPKRQQDPGVTDYLYANQGRISAYPPLDIHLGTG